MINFKLIEFGKKLEGVFLLSGQFRSFLPQIPVNTGHNPDCCLLIWTQNYTNIIIHFKIYDFNNTYEISLTTYNSSGKRKFRSPEFATINANEITLFNLLITVIPKILKIPHI